MITYIDWNIKCHSNITKILDLLEDKIDAHSCIIALQEVMPDRVDAIQAWLGDRFNMVYSLDIEPADEEFDTDNRRLGVMILATKDFEITDCGVFNRTLLPERTCFTTLVKDGREIRVATYHSVVGVTFKMAKAIQFRRFAESLRDYKPNIVSFDANEPKQDAMHIHDMEFFSQGSSDVGSRNGARIFFTQLKKQGLSDTYVFAHKDLAVEDGKPLITSHMLNNDHERRYDFVFADNKFQVVSAEYYYKEAIEATSDPAV